MADLVLHFLLLNRRRPPEGLARLWHAVDPAERAGVERVEEAAVVRVEVLTQVVSHVVEQVERPASARLTERFVPAASPEPWLAQGMKECVQRFSLGGTVKAIACPTCQGKGYLPCDACQGKGAAGCPSCQGKGQRVDPRCEGQGQIATWTRETFEWRVVQQRAELQPVHPAQPLVSAAVDRWLAGHDETVPGLEPEQIQAHLGDLTPGAARVVSAARSELSRMEQTVAAGPGQVSERQVKVVVVPCGLLVRVGGRPGWHWRVGRGDDALTWAPAPRVPPGPLSGLLGMFALLPLGADAVVRGLGLPLPTLSGAWSGLLAVPASLLGPVVALALFILGLVATEPLRMPPPLRLVAVLAVAGPTPYLPLLAAVGSLLRAWDVMDRLYLDQAAALHATSPAVGRGALPLTLRVPRYGRIRLVEVARPQELPDDQLAALLRAVDGVLLHGPADAFTDRVQARIEAHSPSRRPPPCARFSQVLDLEGWRAAWVDPTGGGPDWSQVLAALWAPLQIVLGAPALPSASPVSERP